VTADRLHVLLLVGDSRDLRRLRVLLDEAFPLGSIRITAAIGTLDALASLADDEIGVLITSRGPEEIAELLAQAPGLAVLALADDPGPVAAGAQDALVLADLDGARLGRAVRHAVERARRLDEMRAVADRFQALIENANDVICVVDPAGVFLHLGASLGRALGYAPGELRLRSLFDLVHQGDAERLRDALRGALPKVPRSLTFRLRHRTGAMRTLEAALVDLMDHPSIAGIVVNARDVTERIRAEEEREALRRLSQGLSRAVSAREIGQAAAAEARRLFRNDAFVLSQADESSGDSWTVFAEDTAEGAAAPVEVPAEPKVRDGARRPSFSGEARLINRMQEPTETPFTRFGTNRLSRSLLFAPIRWNGRVCGMISVQSYTPGKYQERDLAMLQTFADQCGGALARVGVEEALRRNEEQLRQALKMEAVGRLAGGMAHDFNNLLAIVLGFADILAEEIPADSPSANSIKAIREAVDRATQLTRQLLAFSRRQPGTPLVLSINDVVRGIGKMLASLFGDSVELDFALDASLTPVRMDRSHLEQIVMNIAVNARDAMPGGGRIAVRTADFETPSPLETASGTMPAGRWARLEMTDDGMGMDAEVRARIFEPFYTTKERGKGTGLGLSMVYGLVRQAGGFIAVASEPARGSTFTLYFPAVDARIETPQPSGGRASRGTETILVVEDEPGVRAMVRQLLERLGYTVVEAVDGEDGLRVAGQMATIDLVLSDVMMPRKAGPEMAAELQARRPGTRILFMSGYAENAIVQDGKIAPGVQLLEKPFSGEALAQRVRAVLDA
jgi:PAS domain S-box-containing protein